MGGWRAEKYFKIHFENISGVNLYALTPGRTRVQVQ